MSTYLVYYKEVLCTPANDYIEALDLFLMECYTGMRISDLLTLKWKHYQDGLIKKKMEKTKDIITIMVAEIDVADKMIEVRLKKATRGNKQLNPEGYIFDVIKQDLDKVAPDKKLNAISSATAMINKDLKKLAKMKKVQIKKNLSTHSGRHTFATRLISKGVDLYTVSKLLGHKDIRTTQIYAQVIQKKQNEALKLLN